MSFLCLHNSRNVVYNLARHLSSEHRSDWHLLKFSRPRFFRETLLQLTCPLLDLGTYRAMPRKKHSHDSAAIRAGAVLVNGQKIKTLRAAKNLTQEELSHRSGVSISAISDMENGGPSFPAKVHDVATILDVAFEELAILPRDANSPSSASVEVHHTFHPDLKMPGSAEQYDNARIAELAHEMMCVLGTKHKITIIHIVDANSVLVRIEIADEDLPKLINGFADKKLDVLQVSEISLSSESGLQKALESEALSLWNIIRHRSFRLWWNVYQTIFRSHVASSSGDFTHYKLVRYLAHRIPPTVITEVNDEHGIITMKRSDASEAS